MLTLEDLGYSELEPEDKKIILLAYIKHLMKLDRALFMRELEFCFSIESVNKVYNKHTGKDSIVRQIERALAESYKKDKTVNN